MHFGKQVGCVGNRGSTKSEIRLHEIWIQDFCKKNVSTEIRRWIQDLDYKCKKNILVTHFYGIIVNRNEFVK